jgi:uncharacterized protein (TIGR02284 family)
MSQQDRPPSGGSTPRSEQFQRGRTGDAPSAADRASDAAATAWKTTREAAGQASDMARDVATQAYDVGRDRARSLRVADSPIATLLVGAALGFGLAYLLQFSTGRTSNRRSGVDDVIGTLNGLIVISRDGEWGFQTAADGVSSAELKGVFEEAARRCALGAQQLQKKVRALGGDPELGGSMSGSVHRGWVNLKSALTGIDELAVLDECERGEDVAKAAYARALRAELPLDVRSLVEGQYLGLKQNHDRVRDLRNARR